MDNVDSQSPCKLALPIPIPRLSDTRLHGTANGSDARIRKINRARFLLVQHVRTREAYPRSFSLGNYGRLQEEIDRRNARGKRITRLVIVENYRTFVSLPSLHRDPKIRKCGLPFGLSFLFGWRLLKRTRRQCALRDLQDCLERFAESRERFRSFVHFRAGLHDSIISLQFVQ